MRKNKLLTWRQPIRCMTMLVILLFLSGCWSADEINDLATINVIGIDENAAGEVEVTTVIAKPDSLFPETAITDNERDKFLIVTTKGRNIFEAMRNLSNTISEKLYFGHVDAIIFGERAARERMESSLDFFKRETDFRPNIQLFVTKGTAVEIVRTIPQQNLTLGLALRDLSHSNRFAVTGMTQDISQFTEALMSNTTDPFTGVISDAEKKQKTNIHGDKRDTKSQQKEKSEEESTANVLENEQGNIPKALNLKGTAVFKKGELKGFLDEKETRGFLWSTGKLKNEVVVLSCGKNGEGEISLNVTDSASKMIPQLSGEIPKMTLKIQAEADIGQVTCKDVDINSDFLNRLNDQFEESISKEVYMALNKVKNQWQTDIFGFGRVINQKNPNKWKEMAPQWRNGLLRDMDIDLRISANISRYGLFKEPPGENR